MILALERGFVWLRVVLAVRATRLADALRPTATTERAGRLAWRSDRRRQHRRAWPDPEILRIIDQYHRNEITYAECGARIKVIDPRWFHISVDDQLAHARSPEAAWFHARYAALLRDRQRVSA